MYQSTIQPLSNDTSSINPREALYQDLKGRTITLPGLKPIFDDWEGIQQQRINPWVDSLRAKVQERVQA